MLLKHFSQASSAPFVAANTRSPSLIPFPFHFNLIPFHISIWTWFWMSKVNKQILRCWGPTSLQLTKQSFCWYLHIPLSSGYTHKSQNSVPFMKPNYMSGTPLWVCVSRIFVFGTWCDNYIRRHSCCDLIVVIALITGRKMRTRHINVM